MNDAALADGERKGIDDGNFRFYVWLCEDESGSSHSKARCWGPLLHFPNGGVLGQESIRHVQPAKEHAVPLGGLTADELVRVRRPDIDVGAANLLERHREHLLYSLRCLGTHHTVG